jgi:hypothetical protein
MQWIKSHLTIVIVGSISLLSLTGLVLGFVLSEVKENLEADSSALSNLESAKKINEKVIEATRELMKQDELHLQQAFQKYQNAKIYTPLDGQVFRDQLDDAARQAAIFRFQDLYARQAERLLEILRAKDMPSDAEFSEYEREIRAKREKAQKELALGLGSATVAPGPGGGAAALRPLTGGARQPAFGSVGDEETHSLRVEYAVSRAKQIRCYASVDSLDVRIEEIRRGSTNRSDQELLENMWYAQVCLWVEEDILKALANLNSKVAKDLPDTAQWVAYMPVKRLVRIAMGNYVPPAGGGGASTDGMAPVPRPMPGAAAGGGDLLTAGPDAVFTKRASTPTVDVLRFHLEVVIDARRLLEMLDAISKAGFYTPLTVDVKEVALETNEYYIYGTAPVVHVTMVYEGCFLRSSYEKSMPQSVKDLIAQGQAQGIGRGAGTSGVRTPGVIRTGGRSGMDSGFEEPRPGIRTRH